MIDQLINALEWRYAVKKFTSKKLKQEQIDNILEAARLAPSSFGLQPYEILVIDDTATREALAKVSMGQRKVAESSHLLVLSSVTTFTQQTIQDYLDRAKKARGENHNSLNGMEKTLLSFVHGQSSEWLAAWSRRQAYIVLGTILCAAAIANIDACPMEGFDVDAYNRILNLTERGQTAAALVTLGFRSSDDALSKATKVRKSMSELVTKV